MKKKKVDECLSCDRDKRYTLLDRLDRIFQRPYDEFIPDPFVFNCSKLYKLDFIEYTAEQVFDLGLEEENSPLLNFPYN